MDYQGLGRGKNSTPLTSVLICQWKDKSAWSNEVTLWSFIITCVTIEEIYESLNFTNLWQRIYSGSKLEHFFLNSGLAFQCNLVESILLRKTRVMQVVKFIRILLFASGQPRLVALLEGNWTGRITISVQSADRPLTMQLRFNFWVSQFIPVFFDLWLRNKASRSRM